MGNSFKHASDVKQNFPAVRSGTRPFATYFVVRKAPTYKLKINISQCSLEILMAYESKA